MNRIVKIGMDVHSTNYTLCAMEPVLDGEDRIFANIQVTPDYKNVLQFIENLKNKLANFNTAGSHYVKLQDSNVLTIEGNTMEMIPNEAKDSLAVNDKN